MNDQVNQQQQQQQPDLHRRWKLSVHGAAVEFDCSVPGLHAPVGRLVDAFAEPDWPGGFTPAVGEVLPYQHAHVARHLSPDARRVARSNDLTLEVYADGERFWLVDERWGMAELNVIKGQWRSWVLPQPKIDPLRCAEMAVLWPMAQVLRARGVCLVPAASAVRDGWAVLILSPFGIEPELSALIRDGYRVIGQRWTAIREEDGRLALLHMPGAVERSLGSRGRLSSSSSHHGMGAAAAAGESDRWVDLRAEHRGAWQNHAFCDAVVVVEPGRRPRPHLRCVDANEARELLRRTWPIAELHPNRRYGQTPSKLAAGCACAQVQLSRDPKDLLALLQSLREAPAEVGDAPELSVMSIKPERLGVAV